MEVSMTQARSIPRAWVAGLTLAAGCITTVYADVSQHKRPCSAANATAAKTAMSDARASLQLAIDSFRSPSPAIVAKQLKWFGPLDSPAGARVQKVYESSTALASFTLVWCPVQNDLDFAWDVGDLAAVHPSEPGAIFLTPKFFQLKTTGVDSQRGTLVHELTHVTGLGLKPEIYGTTNAKALAKNDAARARLNSDNYQYYVEDLVFGLP